VRSRLRGIARLARDCQVFAIAAALAAFPAFAEAGPEDWADPSRGWSQGPPGPSVRVA
jgi:hypothetical protein